MIPAASDTEPARIERVAAFIDGFNVFHGLRHKGFERFYWLDYRALVESFIRPGQELISVRYFTSRVKKPAEDVRDQSTYIDALRGRGGLEIIEGTYGDRPVKCPACHKSWKRPTEKMTDVNVALYLVVGALRNEYDTAYLFCADSDLIPALRFIRSEGRRAVVISPRGRHSDALVPEADANWHIGDTALGHCQLPDPITSPEGIVLRKPAHWISGV